MNKYKKIILSLIIVGGILIIASNTLISPINCEAPPEQDPHDPGNSPGPGLGEKPILEPVVGNFNLVFWDEMINNNF